MLVIKNVDLSTRICWFGCYHSPCDWLPAKPFINSILSHYGFLHLSIASFSKLINMEPETGSLGKDNGIYKPTVFCSMTFYVSSVQNPHDIPYIDWFVGILILFFFSPILPNQPRFGSNFLHPEPTFLPKPATTNFPWNCGPRQSAVNLCQTSWGAQARCTLVGQSNVAMKQPIFRFRKKIYFELALFPLVLVYQSVRVLWTHLLLHFETGGCIR